MPFRQPTLHPPRRRMEINTITGAVSKAGAALGIATPVTTTFANLLTIVDGEPSRV